MRGVRLNLSWSRPLSPGGPQPMYRVTIAEEEGPFRAAKDVAVSGDDPDEGPLVYVTSSLSHGKTYNVSVVAVNRKGMEGESVWGTDVDSA